MLPFGLTVKKRGGKKIMVLVTCPKMKGESRRDMCQADTRGHSLGLLAWGVEVGAPGTIASLRGSLCCGGGGRVSWWGFICVAVR